MYINDSARLTVAGSGITRGQMNKDVNIFSILFGSTVTFQTPNLIRACRKWNILGCDLCHKILISIDYPQIDERALFSMYDRTISDDPRTWKSICVECRRARLLDGG